MHEALRVQNEQRESLNTELLQAYPDIAADALLEYCTAVISAI
jgi:hypothetical protein